MCVCYSLFSFIPFAWKCHTCSWVPCVPVQSFTPWCLGNLSHPRLTSTPLWLMPLHVRTAPTTTTLCLGISRNEEWKDEAVMQQDLLPFFPQNCSISFNWLKLNRELSQFQSQCDLEFIPSLFENLTRLDWQTGVACGTEFGIISEGSLGWVQPQSADDWDPLAIEK